jgi:eukaryotic-like serine/threonine-protein kinase
MGIDTKVGGLFDGRYRLERRIGHGGMADVFLAEDELLGRHVAIKVLADRYARDDGFVERFRREATAAAKLTHPNIVSIYDRGEADGSYYIAMEYLEGRTLKEEIQRRGPLPEDEAIDVALQVLSALQFAHRRGVVHRDIKPHHARVDMEGQAKVTDFGIARAQNTQGMTEVGSIVGTAQYLSPEQARGVGVGPAADLYSLGVVLYEMLTGDVPFSGGSAVEIALKHVNDPPPNVRQRNRRVSPALAQVIMRALAKDPEQRYASAREMADDLLRVRGGGAVSPETQAATRVIAAVPPPAQPTTVLPTAAPPRREEPPPEEPERRRRGALPWLLVALLLLASVGIGYVAYSQLVGAEARIPDVSGQTQERAVQRLEARGFVVDVRTEESADVEEGRVIDTEPPAGTSADEGSTVTLVVSAGPDTVPVPRVAGLDVNEAIQRLADADLQATQETVTAPKVDAGVVVSSDPEAGATVARGSTVHLRVSSGNTTVPDVVGQTQADAEAAIERRNLTVAGVEEQPSNDVAAGVVISTNPSAGTDVVQGSGVTLTVSTGPEPVSVPDVRGLSEDDAMATLNGEGFDNIRIVDVARTDPDADGIVLGQDPPAGSEVEPGSRITLYVGRLVDESGDGGPGPG